MVADQAIAAPPVFQLPITGRVGRQYKVVIAQALVLDDEFTRTELLSHRWNLKASYPCTRVGQGGAKHNHLLRLPLHHLVYRHYHGPIPDGLDVDHIDRNKLNALPTNLRAVSRSKNGLNRGVSRRNSSGFRNVSWHRRCKYWAAYIRLAGRHINLGSFGTAEEAAEAVNRAYQEHYPDLPLPNVLTNLG